jgi:hypothetical protein
VDLDGNVENGGGKGKAAKLFQCEFSKSLFLSIDSRVNHTKPVKKPIFVVVFGVAGLPDYS